MARAIILETSGLAILRELQGFDQLQAAVGGYIQGLPFGEDAAALVNEDGKLLGLPSNQRATALAFRRRIGLASDDYIVGNMVIFGTVNEEGEYTNVPEYLVADLVD